MRRGLTAFSVSLVALMGCGKVSFGPGLDGGGPPEDMGPVDMGPPPVDMGMPDIGMPDIGQPDVGDCMDPMVPQYPQALSGTPWPFERSRAAYEALIWTYAAMPGGGNCSANSCHGDRGNASYSEPLIPNITFLDAQWGDAIDSLWPYVRDADPTTESGALFAHVDGSPNANPDAVMAKPYTQADIEAIESLVNAASDCGLAVWLTTFPGPVCVPTMDAGMPDTGASDAAGDAGDAADAGVDGGGGDAADTGVVDTGQQQMDCYCPVPDTPSNTMWCTGL